MTNEQIAEMRTLLIDAGRMLNDIERNRRMPSEANTLQQYITLGRNIRTFLAKEEKTMEDKGNTYVIETVVYVPYDEPDDFNLKRAIRKLYGPYTDFASAKADLDSVKDEYEIIFIHMVRSIHKRGEERETNVYPDRR